MWMFLELKLVARPARPLRKVVHKRCTPTATRSGSILVLKVNACNVVFDDVTRPIDGRRAGVPEVGR